MPELVSRCGCCCQHLSRDRWLLFVAFHTEQILINQMLKVETRVSKCLENHHGEIWFSLPATPTTDHMPVFECCVCTLRLVGVGCGPSRLTQRCRPAPGSVGPHSLQVDSLLQLSRMKLGF